MGGCYYSVNIFLDIPCTICGELFGDDNILECNFCGNKHCYECNEEHCTKCNGCVSSKNLSECKMCKKSICNICHECHESQILEECRAPQILNECHEPQILDEWAIDDEECSLQNNKNIAQYIDKKW